MQAPSKTFFLHHSVSGKAWGNRTHRLRAILEHHAPVPFCQSGRTTRIQKKTSGSSLELLYWLKSLLLRSTKKGELPPFKKKLLPLQNPSAQHTYQGRIATSQDTHNKPPPQTPTPPPHKNSTVPLPGFFLENWPLPESYRENCTIRTAKRGPLEVSSRS